nr:unnamed protein product [Callosobruchus chinensis]
MSLSETGEPSPSSGYQGRSGPYYGGVEQPSAEHSPYYHWTQSGHQHHRQCSSTAPLGHQTNQHPYYDPGGHLQEPRRFAEAGSQRTRKTQQSQEEEEEEEDASSCSANFLLSEFRKPPNTPPPPNAVSFAVRLMVPIAAPVAVESAYRQYDRAVLPQYGMR